MQNGNRQLRVNRSHLVPVRMALGLLALLLFPAPALAGEGRVLVLQFQGSKPNGIRNEVVAALTEAGYTVPDQDGLGSNLNFKSPDADYQEAAAECGCRAVVTGYTGLSNKKWRTVVTVRGGKTGELTGKQTLSAGWYPGLRKKIKNTLLDRIGQALQRSKAPKTNRESEPEREPEPELEPEEAPEPEPQAQAEPDAEEEPQTESVGEEPPPRPSLPRRKKRQRQDALRLFVGPQWTMRQWKINSALDTNLDGRLAPEHEVGPLGAQAALTVYPAAFWSQSAAAHIGLDGLYERSFVGSTEVEEVAGQDTRRETTYQRWQGGLLGRLPLSPVTVELGAGMGGQSLTLAGEKRVTAQPDANYSYLYAQLGILAALSDSFRLGAKLGYQHLLSLGSGEGELQGENWFPDATGSGWLGRLEAKLALSSVLNLKLEAMGNFVGLTFNPRLDQLEDRAGSNRAAPPVAGGATDLYLGGGLGLELVLQ